MNSGTRLSQCSCTNSLLPFREFNDTIMNIAANLQKTSLKIVDNHDACREQQFLLNLAANLSNAQMQLQVSYSFSAPSLSSLTVIFRQIYFY